MTGAARAGYALAVAVFAVDQFVKWLVAGPLDLPGRLVIGLLPVFDLRFVQNYGVSMGFLVAGSDTERWLLVALTGAIAVGVAWWIRREDARSDALALGAVLGGAAGNILDRVRLGYVFDFLDLHLGDWHPFLVFNVADAAISVGVAVLLLRALFARQPRRRSESDDA